MTVNKKLAQLALDLTRDYPRSPRAKLGGFVVVGRTLDKGRAFLLEQNGDYNFGGLLDMYFLDFAGISLDDFREQIATGANDEEMAAWIQEQTAAKEPIDIIKWNNEMREKCIGDLPDRAQTFMEGYIPKVIPPNRPIYRWFDVYDIEEGRI